MFYAIDEETGEVKWQMEAGRAVNSSPMLHGGVVYFGSHDGYLYAVNLDGSVKWRFATGGPVVATPAVSGGNLVFGSSDGNV